MCEEAVLELVKMGRRWESLIDIVSGRDGWRVRSQIHYVSDRSLDSVLSAVCGPCPITAARTLAACHPDSRQGLSLMHCSSSGQTISATTRGDVLYTHVHTAMLRQRLNTAREERHRLLYIQISLYLTEALCPQVLLEFQSQRVDKRGHVTGWTTQNLSETCPSNSSPHNQAK